MIGDLPVDGELTDVTVPVKLDGQAWIRLKERAERLAMTPEALAEGLLTTEMGVPEELCYIVFEGAPQVWYGRSLDNALTAAHRLAEANQSAASVMAVPIKSVEMGLARRYVGVEPLPMSKLIEREAGEQT